TGINGHERTFVTYQSDGTFWVGDLGNYRYLHFDANRNFINFTSYIPGFYAGGPIQNDPTRVLANFLEFKIDYTKPLAPNNGSWTLLKNWGWNQKYGSEWTLYSPVTFSNGRTYALTRED